MNLSLFSSAGVILLLAVGVALLILTVGQNVVDMAQEAGAQNLGNSAASASEASVPAWIYIHPVE